MDQKWLADRMTARLNRKDGGSETAALEWALENGTIYAQVPPGPIGAASHPWILLRNSPAPQQETMGIMWFPMTSKRREIPICAITANGKTARRSTAAW